jgi:hypothetical protein
MSTAVADTRLLDPVARVSEILFGLIMALTFTATLNATTARPDDVRSLLIATLACNVAWGLVDAVMFLIATLAERGRNLATVRAVQSATPEDARAILAGALPPLLAQLMNLADVERLRQGILGLAAYPERPKLERNDWLRAAAVFLLVVLATFPIVIPFLLIDEVELALRSSNLVAIVMLFAAGYVLARHGGYRPLAMGFCMVLVGVGLVGAAIALGG